MNKKVLYVDMDGVIADFNKAVETLKPGIFELENAEDEVNNICESNPNIFYYLEPIEDGIESVKELMKHYDVYFLSTPMIRVLESFTDKMRWLRKHFGSLADKKLILSHNKGLLKGHYLIDDRIKNGVDKFEGLHIHFGTEKFPNWETVLDYFLNNKETQEYLSNAERRSI